MNKKQSVTALIIIFLAFSAYLICTQNVNAEILSIEKEMKEDITKSKLRDDMMLIKGGNIEIGSGDPLFGDSLPTKTVTVSPFWMDETEVTNSQYREFVYWVRDSIIRTLLAHPSFGADASYRVKPRKGDDPDQYYPLNWRKSIPWGNPNEVEELIINTVMTPSAYAPDEAKMNTRLLKYQYEWFDSKSYYAFLAEMQKNEKATIMVSKDTAYADGLGNVIKRTLSRISRGSKADFTNTYVIDVYPDVLAWMTDFSNAKNEQYVKNYFMAKAFDDYPVVGISWEQADAYCAWRTRMHQDANPNYAQTGFEPYRLPTEAEWEFAARNGRSDHKFPWISDGTHNSKGKANSNFRDSKNLKDWVAEVKSFEKNRFGLYDMAGNVAEWTTTTYTESIDKMADEINPDFSYRAVISDPDILKRKVVKGGSWKDSERFIRADVRAVEYQYKARSYIGFRCVRSWGIDSKGQMQ